MSIPIAAESVHESIYNHITALSRWGCVSVGDCSKFLETPHHQCVYVVLCFGSVQRGGMGGEELEEKVREESRLDTAAPSHASIGELLRSIQLETACNKI